MNIKHPLLAVLAAFTLAACAGSPTETSTGEYIDDATITTKVKTKLLTSEDTSGTAITVETFKGTVQLSGFVKTTNEKQRAEEIAKSVDGVERVENRISVRGS